MNKKRRSWIIVLVVLALIVLGIFRWGVRTYNGLVTLEEGIEGLVHVSEISKEKIKTPVGKFNVGEVITAKVMNINSDERRIGLSIKRM